MSQSAPVKISALGTYVPPRLLTNKDLEKMVDTTDQWILERTGIRERHLVDKGVAIAKMVTSHHKYGRLTFPGRHGSGKRRDGRRERFRDGRTTPRSEEK